MGGAAAHVRALHRDLVALQPRVIDCSEIELQTARCVRNVLRCAYSQVSCEPLRVSRRVLDIPRTYTRAIAHAIVVSVVAWPSRGPMTNLC